MFFRWQIRQAWYALVGTLSKALPLLRQNDILHLKQTEKLVSYVLLRIDEPEPAISEYLWDAALQLISNYEVCKL